MELIYHNNHAYRIRTAKIGDLLTLPQHGFDLCREDANRRKIVVPPAKVQRMWEALPAHFYLYPYGYAQWNVLYILKNHQLAGVIGIWNNIIDLGLDYPQDRPIPDEANELVKKLNLLHLLCIGGASWHK